MYYFITLTGPCNADFHVVTPGYAHDKNLDPKNQRNVFGRPKIVGRVEINDNGIK